MAHIHTQKSILVYKLNCLIWECDRILSTYCERDNQQVKNIKTFLKAVLREIEKNNAILRNHSYAHATYIFELRCFKQFKSLKEYYEVKGTDIKNIAKIKDIYYYDSNGNYKQIKWEF